MRRLLRAQPSGNSTRHTARKYQADENATRPEVLQRVTNISNARNSSLKSKAQQRVRRARPCQFCNFKSEISNAKEGRHAHTPTGTHIANTAMDAQARRRKIYPML
jgi:hypothetical protein